MNWYPHVTVAAIIERDGKFLMVKECIDDRIVYNQPAGHLEDNESILDAVVREVREETAWQFQPEHVVGIYRMQLAHSGATYLRFCFSGTVKNFTEDLALDDCIIEATWLDYEELLSRRHDMRSPLVLRCLQDYLAGQRHPLEILADIGNVQI